MIKVALEDVHFKVAVVGRKLGPNAIQHHHAIVKRKRRSMSILASIQLATFNESVGSPWSSSLQPINLQDVMIDDGARLRTTKRY